MALSIDNIPFSNEGEFKVGKYRFKLERSDNICNCIVIGPRGGESVYSGKTEAKAFGRAMNGLLGHFSLRVMKLSGKKARIEKELAEWKRLEEDFGKEDWKIF